ncbi:MAG: polyprenyl synthetase family protein [Opitutales bacterium]
MKHALKEKLKQYREQVESGINRILPAPVTRPERLHAAMRYSMNAGGKRIRPVLLLATGELFHLRADPLPAAVAMECLHTYTLIHDDLPCVDDSPMRRGQAACHVQFDVPTALLAGDALLTFSFQILAEQYASAPDLATALTAELSDAAGSRHLIGGQMEDIRNAGFPPDAETLHYIHTNKTAALFSAALSMGAHCTNAGQENRENLREAGHHLGLAFQIVDDILDSTASVEDLGKPVGTDATAEKTTYVTLCGIPGARREAKKHTAAALEILTRFSEGTTLLCELIRELENRVN